MTTEYVINNILPAVQYIPHGSYLSTMENLAYNLDAVVANGVSRICLVWDNEDEVVKIADKDSVIKDYCRVETENYNGAKEYGVEKALLPTRRIPGKYTDVYVQKKYDFAMCEVDRDWYNKRAHNSMWRKARRSKDFRQLRRAFYQDGVSDSWLIFAYMEYGSDFCWKLAEWTYDFEVNDLHGGNVGFLDGKPVIIDYAGYSSKYDFWASSGNSWKTWQDSRSW